MKLCIRAHDLGVKGSDALLPLLADLQLEGVQLVCYKAFADIPYQPGGITAARAAAIGQEFAAARQAVPLVGAYFNPVHSDRAKAARCEGIFAEYLRVCKALGSTAVGSETGSFNDDKWTYHPRNRTEEALQTVVAAFSRLCDVAQDEGALVAMEGAAAHVCYSVDTLARAQRMMGRPNTRVIFDLYNYLDGSNQDQYLSILDHGLDTFAGRILLFHIKDCIFQNGVKPPQAPVGGGEMDQTAILRRIKAYDPDAVLMLEGTTGTDNIRRAVRTVREIWAQV